MLLYFTRIKRYAIKPTCENFSSIRYFFYEKTVNAFSIFVFILMAGVFVSRLNGLPGSEFVYIEWSSEFVYIEWSRFHFTCINSEKEIHH